MKKYFCAIILLPLPADYYNYMIIWCTRPYLVMEFFVQGGTKAVGPVYFYTQNMKK